MRIIFCYIPLFVIVTMVISNNYQVFAVLYINKYILVIYYTAHELSSLSLILYGSESACTV